MCSAQKQGKENDCNLGIDEPQYNFTMAKRRKKEGKKNYRRDRC